ncbi:MULTISPECIES: MaoC family dehydratase [unclassified Mesorhizobium]|uniref:MaoC family dehydratase n=1 Tax=unclassified Mesorhizobium TaxID=325217 RepID=UPI0030152B9E
MVDYWDQEGFGLAIDPDKVLALRMPERQATYSERDAMLYALCCGAGARGDLAFVYEDALKVIPSFGQDLCFDDSWLPEAGIDLATVVHGGLDLRMRKPFAPSGRLTIRPSVAGVTDKGEGRPGMVLLRTEILDGADTLFTSYSNLVAMGGGGFGGNRGETFEMIRNPEAQPDRTFDIESRADGPLLFRLLGDFNPLHVVPQVARAAGFDRPIMHGANTFGLVCHAILTQFCGADPARMTRFAARFSGPLYPGERMTLSCWHDGGNIRFAARTVERDSPVLDGGIAEIGPA